MPEYDDAVGVEVQLRDRHLDHPSAKSPEAEHPSLKDTTLPPHLNNHLISSVSLMGFYANMTFHHRHVSTRLLYLDDSGIFRKSPNHTSETRDGVRLKYIERNAY